MKRRCVKEFGESRDDAKIAMFRATVWKDEADRRGSKFLPTLENIIAPLLSFMRVQKHKNWKLMSKGRKQTPNIVKTLRGTDQPCRMTLSEPELEKVIVLPKSGLKGTAKRVFELVATELIHKGILESVGLDLLVAYAREMALYHDTMRELEKTDTFTIEQMTKFGPMTVINPRRKLADAALSNAKSLAAEFGLTPASRSRVARLLTTDAPKDEFADFEEL